MELPVVAAAQGHGELIAGLAAKRPALREAQMMGVAGLAAADQAGLDRDEFEMLPIANTSRFGERECAFVNATDLFSCIVYRCHSC